MRGTVESEQRLEVGGAAVPATAEGALELGRRYLDEVRRFTLGLVRPGPDGLRVLAAGPALIRLGPAEAEVRDGLVACRYAVLGGLLARAGGELELAQEGGAARATLRGFRPRLPGPVYRRTQLRAHEAVGRRYLRRLAAQAV